MADLFEIVGKVSLDGVDKAQNGVVAVLLQLGIVHGGALIAQRALGQQ